MTEPKAGSTGESLVGLIIFAIGGTMIVTLISSYLSTTVNFHTLVFIFVGMLSLGLGLLLMLRSAR